MSPAATTKPKVPDSCCFVIFGITGDLTHRLVIPALYNLAEAGLLPEKFCIVGVARTVQVGSRFAPRPSRPQAIEAEVADDDGQPPAHVVDLVEVDVGEPAERLLDDILGFGGVAQLAAGEP